MLCFHMNADCHMKRTLLLPWLPMILRMAHSMLLVSSAHMTTCICPTVIWIAKRRQVPLLCDARQVVYTHSKVNCLQLKSALPAMNCLYCALCSWRLFLISLHACQNTYVVKCLCYLEAKIYVKQACSAAQKWQSCLANDQHSI